MAKNQVPSEKLAGVVRHDNAAALRDFLTT